MADDIARLGVSVDSTSAVSASKDLDALAAAGDRADTSTKKLKDSWQSNALSTGHLMRANRSLADFRKSNDEAAKAAVKTDESWKNATFSSSKLLSLNQDLKTFQKTNAEAAAAAAKVDESWKKQTFKNSHLLAANRSLLDFRKESAATAAAAVADSNRIAAAAKIQAASHHQVAKAAVGYTKSAKEMAFATRNLPAQFTDIAVSLQAGQNPLTVLLQQGGQLKDMFGGVGPAIKAMGGYVMGLIGPYTLAAAAIGLTSIAWIKGDAEARKFQTTLSLQGDALGITTNGLIQASEEMARFGQSQGAAAAALNTTAASGKIFGDSIKIVAQAALNLEREGGQAVEKTVEQFASLADAPLESALKLDEQYKFLTVSTYEQIRALEEQGDTMGATQVAQEALADSINTRTKEVEENLGYLQQRWRELTGIAKAAWNAMLDIGREDSFQEKIDTLNGQMEEYKARIQTFGANSGIGIAATAGLRRITTEFRAVAQASRAEAGKASAARVQEQGRLASIELAESARLGRSNAEKRVTERAKIEATAQRAEAAILDKSSKDGLKALATIKDNEARSIAAMEKRLADPKGSKPKKSQDAKDAEKYMRDQAREYDKFSDALRNQKAVLDEAANSQDKLTAFEKFAAKTIAELDDKTSKLTATQREGFKAGLEALRLTDQQNVARERQNRILENTADLMRSLAQDEAAQARSINQDSLSVGRGQNEAGLAMALEEIRYRMAEKTAEAKARHAKENSTFSKEYISDLAEINAAEARMANAEVKRLEDRKAAMGDWRNGARAAMEDLNWEMGDVAGRTRDSFMNVFGAMNSALTTFANGGKVKIRDFATTVIAELLRIALTIAASKILQAFLGTVTGTGSMPTAGPTNANGNVFGTSGSGILGSGGGSVLFPNARGNIMTGSTLFPMANGGMGLGGEERAEAIMPLKRGPNGKLGVQSSGGGGNTSVTTNVYIQKDGSANAETSVEGDDQQGRRLGTMIENKVREVITKERQQGGSLWAMQYGR